MISNKYNPNGFTLIELSIVLVIIGLIVGGIVGGSSLIKQARARSVINEVNIIKTAINAFQTQYNAMPGDLTNATTLWPGATTANGDGNGKVDTTNWYNNAPIEDTYVFQHLSLAEVIPGNYAGGPQGTRFTPGVNAINSKYSGALYSVMNNCGYPNIGNAKNTCIMFGGGPTYYGAVSDLGIIPPRYAYLIDDKIDDGISSTGSVLSYRYNQTDSSVVNCVTGGISSTSSNYLLTDSTPSCRMSFSIN